MATSKQYVNPESAITFKASGGTYTFSPASVANGAGRQSAQWNRGSGAQPADYIWQAKTKAGAALAVGASMEILLGFAHSDATIIDGNLGQSDAAFSSSDKKRNLLTIGQFAADSTSNGEVQITSGRIRIEFQYVTVVWWNAFGQTLSATGTDHWIEFIPVPPENQ